VVLKAGKLLYVEWVESTSTLRVELKPGIQIPVHCSASGKLLMAFAPERLRERFLATAPFPACTKFTITNARSFARELELIRRRGYSEDNQEFVAGVCCLAVPVHDYSNEVVAGLAVMAPEASFPLAKAREHLADIRGCADAISSTLGWSLIATHGAAVQETSSANRQASRYDAGSSRRGDKAPKRAKTASAVR